MSAKTEKKDSRNWRKIVIFFLVVVGIFIFVILPWIFVLCLGVGSIDVDATQSDKITLLAQLGQVGDIFGSVNALFSGLAFAALIYTLYLQTQELALQRKDIADSRCELKDQIDVQKSLCLATIAQIKVAAEQAHIEHNKIKNDGISAKNIEEIANKIDKIANELENSFKANLIRNK